MRCFRISPSPAMSPSGCKQEGLPKPEIATRVTEMLALVKLKNSRPASRINCRAGSASAWRSRARSSKRPKVFLLDEPLAALDKKLRDETQFELMALQQGSASPSSSSRTTRKRR